MLAMLATSYAMDQRVPDAPLWRRRQGERTALARNPPSPRITCANRFASDTDGTTANRGRAGRTSVAAALRYSAASFTMPASNRLASSAMVSASARGFGVSPCSAPGSSFLQRAARSSAHSAMRN